VPERDILETEAAAKHVWALRPDSAAAWYRENILNQLKIGAFRAPLLRQRGYQTWWHLADGLAWGIYLGARLIWLSPDEAHSTTALAELGEPLANTLLVSLGSDIWRAPDWPGFLASIVDQLAGFADRPDAPPSLVESLQAFVANDGIPKYFRLRALLSGVNLADTHRDGLRNVISEPDALVPELARIHVAGAGAHLEWS
jgi:hypothetical protein